MRDNTWGTKLRTTIVCIDSYQDGVPVGRFYDSSDRIITVFHSLTQLLFGIERLLQSSGAPPPTIAPPRKKPPGGQTATFAVQVLFQENGSWQGAISWLNHRQEHSFRSVLELILLMDGALTELNTNHKSEYSLLC